MDRTVAPSARASFEKEWSPAVPDRPSRPGSQRCPMTTVKKVALNDVAPNRRRGGDIRVLLGPATVGATAGFFGVLTLAPGEYVSEHYHPYSEEFLYVVSGAAVVRIDGVDETVAEGEGVFVPINAR